MERKKSVGGLPTWLNGNVQQAPSASRRSLRVPAAISKRSLATPLLFFLAFSIGVVLSPAIRTISKIGWSRSPGISPPFTVHPTLFLPPKRFPPSSWPDLSKDGVRIRGDRKVPNVVHYVYGLKEPGSEEKKSRMEGEDLPYYAYLGIRSVILNIKPEKIYFHYNYLPTGPWFDALSPYISPRKIDNVPDHIMGTPLKHFAHKSDILRLDALINTGGIYLDIDMYALRSFEPLMYAKTTLGMEASTHSGQSPLDPAGLCNAVIISAPHASFLERWKASYEDFRDGEWAEHSVFGSWDIARRYPSEVQVLSTRAFFWPGWWGEEAVDVHEKNEYDFYGSGQYAYHAWESGAMRYLLELTPSKIKAEETSFNRMVRPFVSEDDERIYRLWKGVV